MMKRQFRLIGLVALVVLSACNSKSKGPTDTYSSGVVTIAADESFEPIIQEEIEVFENLYPLAGIVPRYTTEVEAINLLLKDSVRLAITTRTLTKEEMNSFHSRKFFPREIKLATDGLALIVNRANPDSLLSVRDFRRILTGEVKNWKEVNPDSRLKGIQVVFDNKNSSTVRFAMDSICGGKPLAEYKARHSPIGVYGYGYVRRYSGLYCLSSGCSGLMMRYVPVSVSCSRRNSSTR